MQLIEWYFDGHCNKTRAKVEYRGCTDWYWISGHMAEREILPTLASLVSASSSPAGIETKERNHGTNESYLDTQDAIRPMDWQRVCGHDGRGG